MRKNRVLTVSVRIGHYVLGKQNWIFFTNSIFLVLKQLCIVFLFIIWCLDSFRAWNKTLAKVSKIRNKNERGVVISAPGVTFINHNCTQFHQLLPWLNGLACLTYSIHYLCRCGFEMDDVDFFLNLFIFFLFSVKSQKWMKFSPLT